MKKAVLLILLIFSFLTIIFFLFKNYTISYKIGKETITESYKSGRYFLNISDKYLMDVYSDRKIRKKIIKNIKTIKDKEYECLILKGELLDNYPVCKKGKVQLSYDLVESEKLEKFFQKKENVKINEKKSFEFFNNLNTNTYISVWKYNGFYIMNGEKISTLDVLEQDRYSNNLCISANEYIFLPNYDDKHVFNSFYVINMINQDYKKFDIDFDIDYDSYILGENDNYIYLYDKKYKIQYKINLKNGKVEEIGNEKNGFIKYENGKKKKTTWNMLDKQKIKFTFQTLKYYDYYNKENKFFKMYLDDKKIKTQIYNKDVDYISSYNEKVYFLDNEYLYEFDSRFGSKKVIRNFEWNFNKENTIFIYNK